VSGRCLSRRRAVLGHSRHRGRGVRGDVDYQSFNGIADDTQVVGKVMKTMVFRVCVLLALAVGALSSCRGYEQIPEDTLADIFKDMYMMNAYLERHNMNLQYDSVDVYGPL